MRDRELKNTTTIKVEIFNFDTLQKLNNESEKLEKTWDELINLAIERLLNDIEILRDLRSTKPLYRKE